MKTGFFIFLLVVVFFVVGYFHGEKKARISMTARFSDREPLSEEQLYELFNDSNNSHESSLVLEILEHVASVLSVDKALLRPSDRFDCELKPPKGWEFGSDITSLSLLLESLAKEKHLHIPPCSIKTLGDYMNVMINLCSDNPKT